MRAEFAQAMIEMHETHPNFVFVSGDLGYPSTAELQTGQFLTAWYELPKDSQHAVLRQARWWLTTNRV